MSISPLDLLNTNEIVVRIENEFLDEGSYEAAERLFQNRYARYKTTTADILYYLAIEAFERVYENKPKDRASSEG